MSWRARECIPSQPTRKSASAVVLSSKVAATPCAPVERPTSFLPKAILIRLRSASSRSTWCKQDRRILMLGAPTSALAPLRTSPRRLPFPLQIIMRGIGDPWLDTWSSSPSVLSTPSPLQAMFRKLLLITGILGSGLIDLCLDACTLEQQRGDGTSNPAPNNQRFSFLSVHDCHP